jgi:hypothetical protein
MLGCLLNYENQDVHAASVVSPNTTQYTPKECQTVNLTPKNELDMRGIDSRRREGISLARAQRSP